MLGLENGVPSVTTPHGIRGYNITVLDGTQGVLLAPPDDPRLFAEQVHRLILDRDLWEVASRGGARHVGEQFSTDLQREDVLRLLRLAKEHRERAV
jgi:glycosyltransferase involved in cell wall biosynthesis